MNKFAFHDITDTLPVIIVGIIAFVIYCKLINKFFPKTAKEVKDIFKKK
jgi:F0F1-type ATP synthase membrane subunit b/b'